MKKKIILSLCVLILLINVSFANSNLILNGSVEEGNDAPNHWSKSVSGAFWGNIGNKGIHSLLLNVSDATADWRSDAFNVSANKDYYFGFWVKGDVNSGSFYVQLRFFSNYGGSEFIMQYQFSIDGNHPEWIQINETLTSPSNAKSCDVLYHAENGNGEIYTDDYFMIAIPEPEEPFWKQFFYEFFFGSGSWLGLIIMLGLIFTVTMKAKLSGIVFLPITILLAHYYFDNVPSNSNFMWSGVLMLCTCVYCVLICGYGIKERQ